MVYADNDLDWVMEQLLPHERKWDMTMCLKDRDFEGGVPVAEAIVEAVEKCRKTLLVITDSFVEDEWCNFTLNMALGKGLGNLVVVLLHDIDMGHPHCKVLSKVIDRLPYVHYAKLDEKTFWKKLTHNL